MLAKHRSLQFYLGVSLGLSLSLLLHLLYKFTWSSTQLTIHAFRLEKKSFSGDNSCLCLKSEESQKLDVLSETFIKGGTISPDSKEHIDDDILAQQLFHNVRIVCWIMTSPNTLESRALHVKRTWTKRCNKVLFMSSEHNASFPTVGLKVTEGRRHLTAKTMKAFKYLHDNHLQDADWFLKADDDTYVIMENLRYLLYEEHPKEAVYFGARFKPYVKQGYTSGGGGYVLSREALRRIGSEGYRNKHLCSRDGGAEDVEIGKCLQNLGVRLKPSLDSRNRTRFHCFSPESVLKAHFPSWYARFDYENGKGGMENISDYAISFHYVKPDQMYALEFYTYHLRPFGVLNKPQLLNVKT